MCKANKEAVIFSFLVHSYAALINMNTIYGTLVYHLLTNMLVCIKGNTHNPIGVVAVDWYCMLDATNPQGDKLVFTNLFGPTYRNIVKSNKKSDTAMEKNTIERGINSATMYVVEKHM